MRRLGKYQLADTWNAKGKRCCFITTASGYNGTSPQESSRNRLAEGKPDGRYSLLSSTADLLDFVASEITYPLFSPSLLTYSFPSRPMAFFSPSVSWPESDALYLRSAAVSTVLTLEEVRSNPVLVNRCSVWWLAQWTMSSVLWATALGCLPTPLLCFLPLGCF